MRQLNEGQLAAINHFTGPCLTLAGPGSGKTLVITARTKTLIEKYGVRPSDILVVTFTKAAAAEMKSRFLQMIGQSSSPVTFGTFHAIFFQILKHSYHYTADNILREEQKFAIMRELVRNLHLDCEDEAEWIGLVLGEISAVKNTRADIGQYSSKQCPDDVFRGIYTRYQETLKRRRLIDFDDMLVYTYELFCEREDILALWQKRFPFILVDEYQDINRLQYEIVKLLAGSGENLFAVGDDDQSIYRFRGAAPQVMQMFEKDYPNAAHIVLEVNYRCAAEIVEKSTNVISHNRRRFKKRITSARQEANAVFVQSFKNQRDENQAVVAGILKAAKEGRRLSEIAILFRTNTQPRRLMEQLMEYNIPFRTKEKIPDLYDHWIARDIFTYLKIAAGGRQRADFLKIMNRPKRYIGRDSLEEPTVAFDVWADYYVKNEQNWIAERIDRLACDCRMLSSMAPYAAVNYIRRGIGYEDYLKEYARQRQIREEDLLEILEEIQEASRAYHSYESWMMHIKDYRRELESQARRGNRETERVSLATFHGAKGLEYDEVFIIDVNEKLMPYKKAVLEDEVEEERRMFYVGMTRARHRLHLYSVEMMNNHEMEPSRFLMELEEEDRAAAGDSQIRPERSGGHPA